MNHFIFEMVPLVLAIVLLGVKYPRIQLNRYCIPSCKGLMLFTVEFENDVTSVLDSSFFVYTGIVVLLSKAEVSFPSVIF